MNNSSLNQVEAPTCGVLVHYGLMDLPCNRKSTIFIEFKRTTPKVEIELTHCCSECHSYVLESHVDSHDIVTHLTYEEYEMMKINYE